MSLITDLRIPVTMDDTANVQTIYQDASQAKGALITHFLPMSDVDKYPSGRIEAVTSNSLTKQNVRHVRFNVKYFEPSGTVTKGADGLNTLAPSSVKENIMTTSVALSFNGKDILSDSELKARAIKILSGALNGVLVSFMDNWDEITIGGN